MKKLPYFATFTPPPHPPFYNKKKIKVKRYANNLSPGVQI